MWAGVEFDSPFVEQTTLSGVTAHVTGTWVLSFQIQRGGTLDGSRIHPYSSFTGPVAQHVTLENEQGDWLVCGWTTPLCPAIAGAGAFRWSGRHPWRRCKARDHRARMAMPVAMRNRIGTPGVRANATSPLSVARAQPDGSASVWRGPYPRSGSRRANSESRFVRGGRAREATPSSIPGWGWIPPHRESSSHRVSLEESDDLVDFRSLKCPRREDGLYASNPGAFAAQTIWGWSLLLWSPSSRMSSRTGRRSDG